MQRIVSLITLCPLSFLLAGRPVSPAPVPPSYAGTWKWQSAGEQFCLRITAGRATAPSGSSLPPCQQYTGSFTYLQRGSVLLAADSVTNPGALLLGLRCDSAASAVPALVMHYFDKAHNRQGRVVLRLQAKAAATMSWALENSYETTTVNAPATPGFTLPVRMVLKRMPTQ